MELESRIALVTGGARRLGRELSLALAAAGMDVVVHHGHAAAEAREVAAGVEARGRRAAVLQADLADPAAAAGVVPRAAEGLGAPDVLINNAAVFEAGTLAATPLESWEAHLAVNLRAPFLLMQAFARARRDTPGKIVNVSDWRASRPVAGHLAYTVARAGLAALTRIAARELAPDVQVNALALGAVLPPAGGGEAAFARAVRRAPAARPAALPEVTTAVVFLLSNDYVTGETLHVDGGAHL